MKPTRLVTCMGGLGVRSCHELGQSFHSKGRGVMGCGIWRLHKRSNRYTRLAIGKLPPKSESFGRYFDARKS